MEIDSEESDDWNKIQHVIDTLRGVDLCPNDEVLSSPGFLGYDKKNSQVPTWRSMSIDLGDCVPFPKAVADLDACQKVSFPHFVGLQTLAALSRSLFMELTWTPTTLASRTQCTGIL